MCRTGTALLAALLLALLLAACTAEPAAEPAPEDDPTPQTETTPPQPVESPADEAEVSDPEPEPEPAPPPAPDEEVDIEISVVATGLDAPWAVAFSGGRAFLTLRDEGRIVELADDGSTSSVVELDVDPAGEGGLLGLAADPDADDVGLYAYLTTDEDNRVVRLGLGGDAEVVLEGIPKGRIHNGGRIAFGPDGMLWIGTGDAGEPELSQDPASLAGKILRITPDGAVPADNPTDGSPVYAMGLRNVQGLTWTADGTMYASEFGPDADDEINRIEAGGNYGWPEVTGEAGDDRFHDPVFVRQPAEASWSGILALVDGAIPQWEGDLFAPSLRGQRLWRIELAEDGTVAGSEDLLTDEHGRLRQAVQAPDGSIWVLTNNTDGRGTPAPDDDRVLRLGPAAS